MKVAFICPPGEAQFVPAIAAHVAKTHEVKECYTNDGQTVVEAVQWSDIVWLEWASTHSIMITKHQKLLEGKKVILRLHSSEAVNGYIQQIDWNKVDYIVFVAEHIRDISLIQIERLTDKTIRFAVVPNGIDLNKWTLKESVGWSPNIAWAPGLIRPIKGHMLMIQCMEQLCRHGKAWTLHVAGQWEGLRDQIYAEHMIKTFGLENNIKFYGYIKDLSEWYKDKSFVASFSQWEGNPVAIMEAMACGLRPVVHNFKGSLDQYKEEWVWDRIAEFVGQVHQMPGSPQQYRDWVVEKWDYNVRMKDIDRVFSEIVL